MLTNYADNYAIIIISYMKYYKKIILKYEVKNLPELGRDPLSEDAFLPLRFLCKPKQPPILLEQVSDSWQPYIYIELIDVF